MQTGAANVAGYVVYGVSISGRIGLLKSIEVSATRSAPGETSTVVFTHTQRFGSSAGASI